MGIRKLRYDGDPILAKRSAEVIGVDDKIRALVKDMYETMYHYNGVGLAAPQIGILKRIVVIDTGNKGEKLTLINPEILDQKEEYLVQEGCLSFPDLYGTVRRYKWVKAKALDVNGKEYTFEARDLLAQAVQHEIDHLNGVLFTELVVNDEYYLVSDNGKTTPVSYNSELHKVVRKEKLK